MPLRPEEQETVIRFGKTDDEIVVFTTYPAHARQIQRKGAEPCEIGRLDGKEVSWTFRLSTDWFKMPGPKRRVSKETVAKQQATKRARAGKTPTVRQAVLEVAND